MRNIIEHKGVTWVDVQNPTKEDVEYLGKNFALHPIASEQLIPPSWTTKVEHFTTHLFLVLFVPNYSKERKATRPRELDIIVGKDFLVTSHYNSILPIKAIFDACMLYEEKREEHMDKGTGFLLYHILHEIWEDQGAKVLNVEKKLTLIEESIFQGKERDMLQEISLAKADIINFWRIVRPQKGTFNSLKDISSEFFGEETVHYFSHLYNHWARVMSTLIIAKETIQSLDQTNNALLTDKTNEIVKLLTIFAVIVFPLTLISSIFGMNTKILPLVGLPGDFWIIAAIMAAGTLLMIALFKKKRWL
ncbi:MAG: magnesium transporter CorA family protein [bacterium]|nr:magnesium transporter CorA family protein [bacterium]